jgi:hypothetical protein
MKAKKAEADKKGKDKEKGGKEAGGKKAGGGGSPGGAVVSTSNGAVVAADGEGKKAAAGP